MSTASMDQTYPETAKIYSVSELARELGVTARTIRFYEDRGLIAPQRAGANRVYSHRDRARMILILRGKQLGFSLREIKEYLDLYAVDTSHLLQAQALLRRVRERIALLEEQRRALDQTLQELREVESKTIAALESRPTVARTA